MIFFAAALKLAKKRAAPWWGGRKMSCQGHQRSFSGFKRELGFLFFPGSTLAFFQVFQDYWTG